MDQMVNQFRQKLVSSITSKRENISKLEESIQEDEKKLAAFDSAFAEVGSKGLTKAGTIRRKPGPKPKMKSDGVKTRKTRKSATEATRKAKEPRKAAKKSPRIAQGRREVLDKKRPSINDAMVQVMGNKVMNATEVYEGLKERGWLPNAKDPRQYIAYLLPHGSAKGVFEKVPSKGRGFYRVKGTTDTTVANDQTKVETPDTQDVDSVLQEAGVIPTVN